MSGRCLVRATAAGVGRSAMYGGGSCQMSVRRRWEERVGGEGTGGWGCQLSWRCSGCRTLLRSGVQQQEVMDENLL